MEEIYMLQECEELVFEEDKAQEWKNLVNELELTGQHVLIGDCEKPIPFQEMNRSMKHIFETLCPRSVEATEYNASAIPLRVLGTIQLCLQEKWFHALPDRDWET